MGRKVGDQWTVPLCAIHHRALHDVGSEERWWEAQKEEPLDLDQRRLDQRWQIEFRRIDGIFHRLPSFLRLA